MWRQTPPQHLQVADWKLKRMLILKPTSAPHRIYIHLLTVALSWTLMVVISLGYAFHMADQKTIATATAHAKSAYNRDVLYRLWNTSLGGVYVCQTEKTPPNPYLEAPERDIATPSGKALTLINPAYMNRQVREMGQTSTGIQCQITSLNPIRPENRADIWEAAALQQFGQGAQSVNAIQQMNGESYLRYMAPLVTVKGCLKCHQKQGYKVGDIQGGISISVPMKPLWKIARPQKWGTALVHFLFWVCGLTAIFVVGRLMVFNARSREAAAIEQEKKNAALAYAKAELKQVDDKHVSGVICIIARHGKVG